MKTSFKYAAVTVAAIAAITSASFAYAKSSSAGSNQDSMIPGNIATNSDTPPSKLSANAVKKQHSKHSKDTNTQTNKNSSGN